MLISEHAQNMNCSQFQDFQYTSQSLLLQFAEDPSLHEISLFPTGHEPNISYFQGEPSTLVVIVVSSGY